MMLNPKWKHQEVYEVDGVVVRCVIHTELPFDVNKHSKIRAVRAGYQDSGYDALSRSYIGYLTAKNPDRTQYDYSENDPKRPVRCWVLNDDWELHNNNEFGVVSP